MRLLHSRFAFLLRLTGGSSGTHTANSVPARTLLHDAPALHAHRRAVLGVHCRVRKKGALACVMDFLFVGRRRKNARTVAR